MEKERNLNYWTIRKFSLLYSYYAIIDTTDYLADQLFVKNEVSVSSSDHRTAVFRSSLTRYSVQHKLTSPSKEDFASNRAKIGLVILLL